MKLLEERKLFALRLASLLRGIYITFKESLYFRFSFWLPIEGGVMPSSPALWAIGNVIKKRFGRKIWQSKDIKTVVIRRKTESKAGKGDLLPDALHKRGRLPICEMARYASGKPLAERSARLVRGNAFPNTPTLFTKIC